MSRRSDRRPASPLTRTSNAKAITSSVCRALHASARAIIVRSPPDGRLAAAAARPSLRIEGKGSVHRHALVLGQPRDDERVAVQDLPHLDGPLLERAAV